MKEIAGFVREGARAYLFKQYRVVGFVFLALFIIFAALAYFGIQNPFRAGGVCDGDSSPVCAGFQKENRHHGSSRTAWGRSSLNRGLQVAFRSGAVMGLGSWGSGCSTFRCGNVPSRFDLPKITGSALVRKLPERVAWCLGARADAPTGNSSGELVE